MTGPAHRTLSVLLADDEEGIRSLITHWLRQAGHEIDSVANGSEALRRLRERVYDVLITDIMMPDGDGYELIASLRAAQPQLRVVAISGGGKYLQSGESLKIAQGLGAHATVIKPFRWEQLENGIHAALAMPRELPQTS